MLVDIQFISFYLQFRKLTHDQYIIMFALLY